MLTSSNACQVQVEIGASDISCKTTLNRYYDFIKIIARKIQTIYDIILS